MAAQREDPVGGGARGILQRRRRHVGLVGLQTRELLVGSGVVENARRSGRGSPGIEAGAEVQQGDLRPGDVPRRFVGQRSAHPEVFLRITRIGSREGLIALDRDIHGEDRARLGDDDARSGFIRALQGDVWVLCRNAAREQQGQCQKSEFHSPGLFIAIRQM